MIENKYDHANEALKDLSKYLGEALLGDVAWVSYPSQLSVCTGDKLVIFDLKVAEVF